MRDPGPKISARRMAQHCLDLVSTKQIIPIEVRPQDAPGEDHPPDFELRIVFQRMPQQPGAETVGDNVGPALTP